MRGEHVVSVWPPGWRRHAVRRQGMPGDADEAALVGRKGGPSHVLCYAVVGEGVGPSCCVVRAHVGLRIGILPP